MKLRGTPESVPEAIAVVLNLILIMSWGSSAKRTRKTESLRSAKAIGIYSASCCVGAPFCGQENQF